MGTGRKKYEANEDVRKQHHKALLHNHLFSFLTLFVCSFNGNVVD